MRKPIVFTGGSGKTGEHALNPLVAKGYSILNVDLKPVGVPGVDTLIADLTDSGQALTGAGLQGGARLAPVSGLRSTGPRGRPHARQKREPACDEGIVVAPHSCGGDRNEPL